MKPHQLAYAALPLLFSATAAQAHFGMVIPSRAIVTPEQKEIELTLSFSHPFEGIGMDMEKPVRFSVVTDGRSADLLPTLQQTTVMEHAAWETAQRIARPGVYQYVMEPAPYWEPAEDIFIVHYTKTIVAAFGDDQGWDEPVGLPTEIVPLSRPFGNYAGNSFTGQVLVGGQPAGGAEVEVELYNRDGLLEAPTDYHVTQVVRADGNGIFTFACPLPGWWGFSALSEADHTLTGPDGKEKTVELGAVLWVKFDDLTPAKGQ